MKFCSVDTEGRPWKLSHLWDDAGNMVTLCTLTVRFVCDDLRSCVGAFVCGIIAIIREITDWGISNVEWKINFIWFTWVYVGYRISGNEQRVTNKRHVDSVYVHIPVGRYVNHLHELENIVCPTKRWHIHIICVFQMCEYVI